MTRKKTWLILSLALVCLLSGCGQKTDDDPVPELLEPAGVMIDTATVVRGDLYTLRAYEGNTVAAGAELSFETDGRLAHVDIYPGMWAHKGDVLLTLDQSDMAEQMQDLRRQIDYQTEIGLLQDEIDRLDIEKMTLNLERLRADGQADPRDIELAALDIEQAELNLSQSQELRALSVAALQEQYDALEAR